MPALRFVSLPTTPGQVPNPGYERIQDYYVRVDKRVKLMQICVNLPYKQVLLFEPAERCMQKDIKIGIYTKGVAVLF
jgi:hypothetical protein